MFFGTNACYGGSNGAKDISPHPHKWPLPVQRQNCFRVCISEEPLCLKCFSVRMLVMEGQMVQKTSPISLTNGHFLFNARIASGFYISEEPLCLKCFRYECLLWRVKWCKRHLPSPSQMATSCSTPELLSGLHFGRTTMFEMFFGMDACYGGSNCTKDAKITSGFCILTNFRIKASSRRIAETQWDFIEQKKVIFQFNRFIHHIHHFV